MWYEFRVNHVKPTPSISQPRRVLNVTGIATADKARKWLKQDKKKEK
jgi:hypothetical protein